MENVILILVFSLLILDTGFNLFLSILNYKYRNKELPVEISDVYDTDTYLNWKKYYMENFKLSLISSLTKFLILIILLVTKTFVYLNDWATNLTSSKIFQTLLILGFYFFLSFIIEMIFSYISVFKIEEKYGFNKMTKKLFFMDKIKGLLFTIIFVGGLIYGVMSLYFNSGQLFFIIAWISGSLIILIVNLLYTKVFVPIFNKLTPLEDSTLKTKIYDFAESVGYEIKKISVMDASKRSSKLNAFFSGFGKAKRIVLYDTLINKCTEEEIVAVLAHEIGHGKHKHVIFNLFQSILMISVYILGLMLFLNYDIFSLAFGFSRISFGFNIILYIVVLTPLLMFLGILTSYISRKFEYQADGYAAINYSGEHLISALKVLNKENFSNLTPHPLYVKFYYSHPPLLERINHIKTLKKDKS